MDTYSGFIKLNEKRDLGNYYYFKNGLSAEDIKKVEKIVEDKKLENGKVSTVVDKTYRNSQITWIPFTEENKWLYEKIGVLARTANDRVWKFSLIGMTEHLQYGEYHESEQGHYDWHMDVGMNLAKRKVSVTVQLSDPSEYEGGELQFMLGRNVTIAPKEKGLAVVFPSYFLHKVTPVTRGVRKSLVIWVSGEPFR